MKTYAEFLTEAAKLPSEAELTKVFFQLDPKDRGDFLKWKAKAIEMYNIDNSSFTMSQENNFNKPIFNSCTFHLFIPLLYYTIIFTN